jgi:hypothetical protein
LFDGSIENPAALIGLMAAAALTLVWGSAELLRAARGPRTPTLLGGYGLGLLFGVWLLVPLNVLNHKLGGALSAIFSAEGNDTGLVEAVTNLQWLACALLALLIARARTGWMRWLFVGGGLAALVIFGEEVSWGQWLWRWESPEVFAAHNLQKETNLHNFAPPEAYDVLYRAAGWVLVAAALAVRYLRAPARLPLGAELAAWINRTRLGLPLALTAATLLQHPAFQELSEAALSGAGAHALAFVLLRAGARPAPAWEAILPFTRRPDGAGVNDFGRGAA